jgi:hypothetical protein
MNDIVNDMAKELISLIKADGGEPYYLDIQMNAELILKIYRKAFGQGKTLEEFVFECILKGLGEIKDE